MVSAAAGSTLVVRPAGATAGVSPNISAFSTSSVSAYADAMPAYTLMRVWPTEWSWYHIRRADCWFGK